MPRPCRDQGSAKQSNTTFIHRTLAAKKLSDINQTLCKTIQYNVSRPNIDCKNLSQNIQRQPSDFKQTTVSETLCIDCKTIQNNVRPPSIDCKVSDKTWVRSRGWDGVSVGRCVGRLDICHKYHKLYLWSKVCPVEKFQISVKNLNNLWSLSKFMLFLF